MAIPIPAGATLLPAEAILRGAENAYGAVVDSYRVIAGYTAVATLEDRDNIDDSVRREGLLVYVAATGQTWRLDFDLVTWLPTGAAAEIVPGSGIGIDQSGAPVVVVAQIGTIETFAGAGPHALFVDPADVSVVLGVTLADGAVVTLPALADLVGTRPRTVRHGGTAGYVLVAPVGGDTLDLAMPAVLAGEGSLTVVPDRDGGVWRVLSYVPGRSDDYENYVAGVGEGPAGDDAGLGTAAAPLATVGEGLRRAQLFRWRATATLRLLGGAHTLGTAANLLVPGVGELNAGPFVIACAAVDSGLGERTATAGGVVGGAVNNQGFIFGTIVDSVGGLAPSAWRGWILRLTSGAAVGREYVIDDNSATTFTIVGDLPAGGITSGTFVVERGAATLTADSSPLFIRPGSGTCLVLRRVRMIGSPGSLVLSIAGRIDVLVSASSFEEFGNITPDFGGTLDVLQSNTTAGVVAADVRPAQTVGCYATTTAARTLNVSRGARVNLSRSLVDNLLTNEVLGAQSVTYDRCSFRRAAGIAVGGAYLEVTNTRFTGVATLNATNGRAVIAYEVGSSGNLQNITATGTTSAAGLSAIVLMARASLRFFSNVSGGVNAAVQYGLVMRYTSTISQAAFNTLGGSINEVSVGAAAATTFAVVDAPGAKTSDQAAVGSEFCLIGLGGGV